MKALTVALSFFACSVFASEVGFIRDFNYQLTDLAHRNLNKEDLFARMLRKNVDETLQTNRSFLNPFPYDHSKQQDQ